MTIAVAFFAAVAILCCASADNVSTSLLLPNGLFSIDPSFKPPTFVGQVTVIMSTIYYTLDCDTGAAATYFYPIYECIDSSYTFSEISASTQYLIDDYLNLVGSGAASSSTKESLQTWTINCSPLGSSSSATCTTTYTDVGVNDTYSIIDPEYTTTIESSLYAAIFTTAVDYKTASSTTTTTSALPSPSPSASTAKPTTTSSPENSPIPSAPSPLPPSSKIGLALGVPLGACALAALALLLYRHTKHKERSRKNQMENLPAPPPGAFVAAESNDAKKVSEVGVEREMMGGREPPVYSMEMQG